jgi:hypothetical protein
MISVQESSASPQAEGGRRGGSFDTIVNESATTPDRKACSACARFGLRASLCRLQDGTTSIRDEPIFESKLPDAATNLGAIHRIAGPASAPNSRDPVSAEADLERLLDFVLQRELTRHGDLALAERGPAAISAGFETLRTSPFTCRKAGRSPFLRELIIPLGRSGYVALFEIVGQSEVVVAAVLHQLVEDYD